MNAAPEPADEGSVFDVIWARFEEGRMIPQCAWCGRVRLGRTWTHPPPGALAAIDARLTVSHSICPECTDVAVHDSAAHPA